MEQASDSVAVILAGGSGCRLAPVTRAVNKHLLPVLDRPMIYFPLTQLIRMGHRTIALVSSPEALPAFRALLGDGGYFGIHIHFFEQSEPGGIAHALGAAREFWEGRPVSVALGDNLFLGGDLRQWDALTASALQCEGAVILGAYPSLQEPEAGFGYVIRNASGQPLHFVEKPDTTPIGGLAVPGLYFYDRALGRLLDRLEPSARGELEITGINQAYLDENALRITELPREMDWIDLGESERIYEASAWLAELPQENSLHYGVPEWAALEKGWLQPEAALSRIGKADTPRHSSYYDRLASAIRTHAF